MNTKELITDAARVASTSSVAELSRMSGISPMTLYRMYHEKIKMPNKSTLIKLKIMLKDYVGIHNEQSAKIISYIDTAYGQQGN